MQRSIGLRVASRQQQQHSSFRWCCQPLLRVATSSSCSRLYYTHHHHHHRYFSSSSSSSSSSRRASRKRWTLDAATGIVSSLDDDDTEQPRQQRRFQTIIGLEIHAQLDIPTKLFSPALTTSSSTSTTATARPNDYENLLLHPLDAAIPGYLPVLSQEAVQAALVAATVLNCQHIPAASRFERKHYSYADLPFGYQITQQRWPLARNGFVQASAAVAAPVDKKKKNNKNKNSSNDNTVTCRINRIQLEQDTGKTTTTTTTMTIQQGKSQKTNSQQQQQQVLQIVIESSRVDLNRAGCALLEIVTEPDLRTPRDAARIVETIRQLLTHVKVCTGRMEHGHLRVDLNVNIEEQIMSSLNDENNDETMLDDSTTINNSKRQRKPRRSPRVEVKNLNSIRQVQQAAEYEVLRQAREWQDNDDIDINSDNHDSNSSDDDSSRTRNLLLQEETRTWNASTKQTILIRRKDQEHDYRFLPEPDLPPLVLYPPATVKRSNKKNGGALLDDNDDDDNSNNDQHGYDDDDLYLFPNETAMHNYIQATMPELPTQAMQRLVTQYGLSDYQARVITSDPPAIAYFDRAYTSTIQALLRVRQQQQNDDDNDDTRHDKTAAEAASMVANYLCNDLFGLLKDHHHQQQHQHHHPVDDESFDSGAAYAASLSIQDSPVTAEQLGELVALVLNGIISKTMAKNLLAILYNTSTSTSSDDDDNNNMLPLSVAQIASKHGFQLVSDPVQLREHVQKVLRNDVEAHDLERYFTMDHKVQAKLLKFFTGQCMAASKGNAEPEALREALEQVLLQMQQERK